MRARVWALVCVLGFGGFAAAEVVPGEVRAVQVRGGVPAWKEPRVLSGKVGLIPFATRVTVDEVRAPWVRVTADGGVAGWVRASDIVEPGSLTGTAARAASGRAGAAGTADVSLAGRQFDESLEGELKVSDADLQRAYPLVDALEAKSFRPGDPEIEKFLRDGRLGGEVK
jgi:hypothetical protein